MIDRVTIGLMGFSSLVSNGRTYILHGVPFAQMTDSSIGNLRRDSTVLERVLVGRADVPSIKVVPDNHVV